MARRQQAYDLNKQVRLLDIHKQFMGGLKTIDTDDALGSAYLRDVDNLSISEFGFLEKRYGTYVNDEIDFESFSALSDVDLTKPIQGYFEYIDDNGGVHKIIFIDGVGYIKQPDDNIYRRVNAFSTEPGFDYPDAEEIIRETNWESTGIEGQSIENLSIQLNFRIDAPDQIELTRNVFSGISLNPDIRRFDIKTFDSSTEANLSLNEDIIKIEQDVQVIDHFVDANISLNVDIFKVVQDVQVITSFVDANLSLNPNIKRFDIKSLSKTHSVTSALNESITKFEQDPPDNQTLTRTKNGIIHLNEDITKFEQDPPPPPPPTVTATFDSAGGTPTYSSQSGPSPLNVTNPGSPTRSGFTFGGWSPSLPTTITSNTTFTAQWNALDNQTLNKTSSVGTTLNESITKFEQEPQIVLEPVFIEVTENNACLWTRVRISNPNTSSADLYFRRSGGDWKLMGSLGAEGNSVFTFSDSSGSPFSTRTYDMKFEIPNVNESDVSQFSVTKQSCTFGSVPGDAVVL